MDSEVLLGSDQDGLGMSTSGGRHMLDGLEKVKKRKKGKKKKSEPPLCNGLLMVCGWTEERIVDFLPAMRSREIPQRRFMDAAS